MSAAVTLLSGHASRGRSPGVRGHRLPWGAAPLASALHDAAVMLSARRRPVLLLVSERAPASLAHFGGKAARRAGIERVLQQRPTIRVGLVLWSCARGCANSGRPRELGCGCLRWPRPEGDQRVAGGRHSSQEPQQHAQRPRACHHRHLGGPSPPLPLPRPADPGHLPPGGAGPARCMGTTLGAEEDASPADGARRIGPITAGGPCCAAAAAGGGALSRSRSSAPARGSTGPGPPGPHRGPSQSRPRGGGGP